jgi:hypothetical protein
MGGRFTSSPAQRMRDRTDDLLARPDSRSRARRRSTERRSTGLRSPNQAAALQVFATTSCDTREQPVSLRSQVRRAVQESRHMPRRTEQLWTCAYLAPLAITDDPGGWIACCLVPWNREDTDDRFEDRRPDRLLTGLLETDGGYLEPTLT